MKRTLAVVIGFWLVVPASVSAAELFFGAKAPEVALEESFAVGVFLDAQGLAINAIEGAVTYDGGALRLEAVRDGESVVPFWIERPQAAPCEDACSVRFSGVIPGGLTQPRNPLFSLVFTARRAGDTQLTASGFVALLNDGKGTPAAARVAPIRFGVRSDRTALPLSEAADEQPPEPFIVTIVQDPRLYENRVVAVFSAVDKQTGISHYEVAERLGPPGPIDELAWQRADSPYLLTDQALGSSLYVKAVDRAGNARVGVVAAGDETSVPTARLFRPALLYGILVFIIAATLLRRFVWRKSSKDSPLSR